MGQTVSLVRRLFLISTMVMLGCVGTSAAAEARPITSVSSGVLAGSTPQSTIADCGGDIQGTIANYDAMSGEWSWRMTSTDMTRYINKEGLVFFTVYDDNGSTDYGPYNVSPFGFNVPLVSLNSPDGHDLKVQADVTNAANATTYCSGLYTIIKEVQNKNSQN